MKAALGSEVWKRTTRLALFDHAVNFLPPEGTRGKALTAFKKQLAANRAATRAEAIGHIVELKPKVVICLGTRSITVKSKDAESGEAQGHRGCMSWELFNAPETLESMAGTLWTSGLAHVIGVPHPGSQEFVHGELFRRWCTRALTYSQDRATLLLPPSMVTEVSPLMLQALNVLAQRAAAGAKISVDIESYMDGSVITCVGLSDGETTVSVPWEAFVPHGTDRIEAPAPDAIRKVAADILAMPCPKVLHNGISFDGPLLAQHGTPMNGRLIDTYLMHGAIYNQFRHGLQAVAAQLFLVPPWKSMHRKSVTATGLTLDDAEAWIQDPKELRRYNAQDTYYTAHIERALDKELL